MKRVLLLFIVLGLVIVSCGTTRFSFGRTERNIVKLGGKYDKETEEEIKKLYEKDGLDEVIKEVYEGTYTVIDVQGYLGDDIWKEYQKRDEELLKEIETLRKTEGLDAVVSAVLDETYPENMVVAAFGGEEKRLAADFRKELQEKKTMQNIKDSINVEKLIFGTPIYKSFVENGEEIYRWAVLIWINEFDVNGRKIYEKYQSYDGDIEEYWFEYNDNGNLLSIKSSDGRNAWFEYDKNGNEIHYKNSRGFEYWVEYDSNGNKVHMKYSIGSEFWSEYDTNGNKTHSIDSDGNESWYEYDANGNKTHSIDSDGNESWYEYDANGNEIHYRNSTGDESWTEYDANNNIIYNKDSDGDEIWYQYDFSGNKKRTKTSNGYESWYEYEFWENGQIKTELTYKRF